MMWMNDRSLLKIPFYKIIVEFLIRATFVTIIPEDDRGMIQIS